MIDEASQELLSRRLDGDLDAEETRVLEARLRDEEPLRRELVGLERIRAALQQLGASEQPPASLDRIVEPLVVGPGPITPRRPWVRWLASAAVVVLGLTVMLEVSEHRSPQPTSDWHVRARERSAGDSTERFKLAPLPTRAPAAEASPRGASERLLATEDPEIDTTDQVPPALEVVGPLEHPPTERQDDDVQNRGGRETVDPGSRATQKASVQTPDSGHITNPGAPRSSASGAAPRGEQERGATVPREGKGNDRPPLAARAAGQLMVFVGAETAWRNFEPEVRCDPGRYAVRVRIEGGVVRKVWPVWKPLAAPSESLMASQLVLGLEIDNVGDGEYPAEVVIEPRQPTSR